MSQQTSGADDRARTGDLDLGKVALYQLSYVRVKHHISPFGADNHPRSPVRCVYERSCFLE